MLVGVTGYGTAAAVPPARRTRPGAHPGAGRDRDRWWSSCWCCAGCREYFTDRPLTRAALLADGARRAGRRSRSPASCSSPPAPRTADPVSAAFPRRRSSSAAASNIVNVTLVDIRAWDTMGEISVLVAAATGVASLHLPRHPRRRASGGSTTSRYPASVRRSPDRAGAARLAARRPDPAAGPALDHLRGRHPAALPHA